MTRKLHPHAIYSYIQLFGQLAHHDIIVELPEDMPLPLAIDEYSPSTLLKKQSPVAEAFRKQEGELLALGWRKAGWFIAHLPKKGEEDEHREEISINTEDSGSTTTPECRSTGDSQSVGVEGVRQEG